MNFERIDKHNIMLTKTATVEQLVPAKDNEVVSLPVHNGHKIFEFNMRKKEMDEVKYISRKKHYLTGYEELTYKNDKDCIYIPALNEKNAMRKFTKWQKVNLGVTVTEIK